MGCFSFICKGCGKAILSKCYTKDPKTRSQDDPNQGCGYYGELMGNIDEYLTYES